MNRKDEYYLNRMLTEIPSINNIEPFQSNLSYCLREHFMTQIIYCSILLPYLIYLDKHKNDNNNQEIINNILRLIEDIAVDEDFSEVGIAASFIRGLVDEYETEVRVKFLFQKSFLIAKEIIKEHEYNRKFINHMLGSIEEMQYSMPKELDERLKECINERLGLYTFYEDILVPYFIYLTKSMNLNNKKIIDKISLYVENLYITEQKDIMIRNLIDIGFIESLVSKLTGQTEAIKFIETFLGPKTSEKAKTFL